MKTFVHKLIFNPIILMWCLCIGTPAIVKATAPGEYNTDLPVTSTQQQAITYIEKIKELKPSVYWPNIKPTLFLKNLKIEIKLVFPAPF